MQEFVVWKLLGLGKGRHALEDMAHGQPKIASLIVAFGRSRMAIEAILRAEFAFGYLWVPLPESLHRRIGEEKPAALVASVLSR